MGASIVVSEAGWPWPAIPSRSYAVAVASKYRKPGGCQCYNGVRVMNDKLDKTTVVVRPTSHQPSKAELEEDMSVDAAPEALADCIGRTVATTKPTADET